MAVPSAEHLARSCYFSCLEGETRQRYTNKSLLTDGIDPYIISKGNWSGNTDHFPSISFRDLVSYLLFTKSAYTTDELRSYKGLEAYNEFVSGWVREVQVKQLETCGRGIMSAKLSQSQETVC